MVYAIRVQEIHAKTFLVEADDVDEAIAQAEEFNNEVGFELDDITEINIDPSPYAKVNGEATEEQKRYCEWLD